MDYLPIFLDIRDRSVLVVGGGAVAARKAGMLLRAGGRVIVVAPDIRPEIGALARAGRIRCHHRVFQAGDLKGVAVVVAATGESTVNRRVYAAAQSAGIPVNVVDQPALSSFIFPAVIDRSPLVVAVSSGGAAPVLARHLRARIESLVPHGYGALAALAGRFRAAVRGRISDPAARRRFWERVFDGPVAEAMLAGRTDLAESALSASLEADSAAGRESGEVYLVGAGPGDPDLLTFRALRLMQQADVVLYDRLVSQEVLDLVRRDAERIDVGKRRGDHAMRQDDIGELLVRLALEGRRVLRLKGGDPFVFGRGGEELSELARHGIAFQIVPGITSATGCAAYAGIPLTHRDYAQSCVFVTGHRSIGTLDLDWPALARGGQTVVVYMGLRNAATIARELIDHGADPARPAAIVADGTRANQRVTATTLAALPDAAQTVTPGSAALIIIGEVVQLAPSLSWFAPRGEEENAAPPASMTA